MTRTTPIAALLVSAAFVFPLSVAAQPPVVDASIEQSQPTATAAASQVPAANSNTGGSNQGELFYQLQLLQQEVMQLRGVVEEQTHQVQQLKKQNMERYIDLDRRVAELAAQPKTVVTTQTTQPAVNTESPTTLPTIVAPMKGEKEAYDKAYQLVTAKRFAEAQDAFKQFLVDFPDGKYAPNSYYWLGELYQVVQPKDLESSRQAFTQLLDQYPNHPKAPDAMYKLGKVYFLKGNKTKAKHWLDKVIADYGTGVNSAAKKAQQFLQENY
jgi:tol-pal system protein YbgF